MISRAYAPCCAVRPARGRTAQAPLLALRRVLQEDVPDRGRVYTGDALGRRRQVIVEIRVDDRCLVEQQLLDLPGDGALRGHVRGRDVLLDQAVVLRVAEVRGVPCAGARFRVGRLQRRAQEQV